MFAASGTVRAFFRGNGANVIKIAPETAMKLTLNDRFKNIIAKDPEQIQPSERMVAGGLAGAVAQVSDQSMGCPGLKRFATCSPSLQYNRIRNCTHDMATQPAWRNDLVQSGIGPVATMLGTNHVRSWVSLCNGMCSYPANGIHMHVLAEHANVSAPRAFYRDLPSSSFKTITCRISPKPFLPHHACSSSSTRSTRSGRVWRCPRAAATPASTMQRAACAPPRAPVRFSSASFPP